MQRHASKRKILERAKKIKEREICELTLLFFATGCTALCQQCCEVKILHFEKFHEPTTSSE